MGDAHLVPAVIEADHEKRVLGRHARAARDERGIPVELDSGELDRAFGLWGGDDSVHFAGERRVDRSFRRIERCFPVRRRDLTDVQFVRLELLALEEDQRAVAPVRVGRTRHGAQVQCEATGGGVRLERSAVADQQRPADFIHLRVERGFERDLGADTGRVADGDGDAGQAHQSTFTRADSITLFQRSSSRFMNAAISTGVPPIGSAERFASRSRTSGMRITSMTAAESFSTIGIGVFGGATIPNHATELKPERISDIAGTLGVTRRTLGIAAIMLTGTNCDGSYASLLNRF